MGAPVGDQVARGGALGVQGISGDRHRGQVEPGQQRREFGDLVGLGGDLSLREHHASVVADRREQMHLPTRRAAWRRQLGPTRASTSSTHCGASAAHSPIAANERAPHSTATDAIVRIVCTWWRIPRARLGSGTPAKRASRSRQESLVNGGQGITDRADNEAPRAAVILVNRPVLPGPRCSSARHANPPQLHQSHQPRLCRGAGSIPTSRCPRLRQ